MTDSTRDWAEAKSLDELRDAVKRAEARIPAANEAIFAALRSERAQGMREAADTDTKDYWSSVPGDNDFDIDRFQRDLRTRADAIERGE